MQKFKNFFIILLLFTLIFSPRILFGLHSEKLARQAVSVGDFAHAAENFKLAAERLFWRGDLWDETGKAKLISGQRTEAILAYEKAKGKNALSAFGWDILGQESWNQGKVEEAITLWKTGLNSYPAYFEFYTRLAMAYREKGDHLSEKKALENRLAYENEEKASAYFHYRLGLLLILDSSEEALDELSLAARVDKAYAPVVETLRTSLNLALLESNPAEKLILLGRGLALVEEWQLAAEMFTNATQTYPESASAWAWLGEAKQHLNEDPLQDLDKALNLNPKSILVHSLRGLYWQRLGNVAEALREFEVTAKIEPENPNWQSALGEIYARSGNLPLALASYQRATELAPDNPTYWQLLALFSAQYTTQLEEVGLPAAKKAVALHPTDAALVDTLGWVYFGLGRDEDAAENFLYALALDPNLGAAHLHLGMFYLKENHRDLAQESLLMARDLSVGSSIGEQAERLLDEFFQE